MFYQCQTQYTCTPLNISDTIIIYNHYLYASRDKCEYCTHV